MIAGAGSGKTRVLTARFLAVLNQLRQKRDINAGAALAGIAAITFTRKASAEMRKRIAECCAELSANDSEGFWAETALKMAEARISTIHKFCGRIIGEYPIEAGIASDNLEGSSSQGDVLRVANRYCRALSDENHPLHQTTKDFARLTEWRILPSLLSEAFSKKTSFLIYHSELPETADELARLWQKKAEQILLTIDREHFVRIEKAYAGISEYAGMGSPDDELAEIIEKITGVDFDSKNPQSVVELAEIISKDDGSLRKFGNIGLSANWPKGTIRNARGAVNAVKESIAVIASYLPKEPDALDIADAQAVILFKRIFEGFLRDERENLPPETAPDFEDLLIAANRIVQTEGMAQEIAGGLAGLMVDEFQDTDPLQWDTIRELAENIGGKLFWVGDPKQSIYEFRGADVSNVHKGENWVTEKEGEVFSLSGNYRTAPAVLAFANKTSEDFLSETPLVNLNFHAFPQKLSCERPLPTLLNWLLTPLNVPMCDHKMTKNNERNRVAKRNAIRSKIRSSRPSASISCSSD